MEFGRRYTVLSAFERRFDFVRVKCYSAGLFSVSFLFLMFCFARISFCFGSVCRVAFLCSRALWYLRVEGGVESCSCGFHWKPAQPLVNKEIDTEYNLESESPLKSFPAAHAFPFLEPMPTVKTLRYI